MTENGIFITDFDVELELEIFSILSQSKTRKVGVFHSPASRNPKTISEDIDALGIAFSGAFRENVVEQGRKMQYLLHTNNDILLIYFDRDLATYVAPSKDKVANDKASVDNDLFSITCKAKGEIQGQVREAVDTRCTTDGEEVSDSDALRNKAIRINTTEYVYFDIGQNAYLLPVGNYELIARMKAEQADTAKMEVKNTNDIDQWIVSYDSSATKILCLKEFDSKLYAGADDGKIYVSEDGNNFALIYDTGQAEVHCFEEYGNCLYAGTGNSGKIYKFDAAAWVEEYDTGETDVFTLKSFSGDLYAGTGANGILFSLNFGLWVNICSTETSIFCLEVYNNKFYGGTGANGKIYEFLPSYTPPASYPTGLTHDGTVIWSCDGITDKIYKHNADLTVNTEYAAPGTYPTGLAYDGTVIWSCDSNTDKIYKHNADLTVNTEYAAPSTYPNGLTYDGTVIWSCDRTTNKIYKHNADLTVNTEYAAPGTNPSGLTHDGSVTWSCDLNTNKIYKHNVDMTVNTEYDSFGSQPSGLAHDGTDIWSCDHGIDKIYKRGSVISHDATDTNIYALKIFDSNLYAGGDEGKIYKYNGTAWSTDYTSGEADILSLYEHNSKLYAGSGNLGKLFVLNGSWALSKDTDETAIYAGVSFDNKHFIGTGNLGKIYLYRDGILATAQKTLTTAYALYKLAFTISDYDLGDTIRFQVTQDGSTAAWTNIDFICFAAKE